MEFDISKRPQARTVPSRQGGHNYGDISNDNSGSTMVAGTEVTVLRPSKSMYGKSYNMPSTLDASMSHNDSVNPAAGSHSDGEGTAVEGVRKTTPTYPAVLNENPMLTTEETPAMPLSRRRTRSFSGPAGDNSNSQNLCLYPVLYPAATTEQFKGSSLSPYPLKPKEHHKVPLVKNLSASVDFKQLPQPPTLAPDMQQW